MKIALAQIDVISGNPEANFKKIRTLYKSVSKSVDIVAFPEMALPGYFVGDSWEQNSFLRECEALASELAKQSTETLLVFGSVGIDWTKQNEDGRVRKYNAAFCAQNEQFIKHPKLPYPFWIKSLSPNYRMFDESRHFYDLRKLAAELGHEASSLLAPLLLRKERIALHLCEDAWDENYPFHPVRELCKQGMDFILNLSCSPYTLAKTAKRNRLFRELVRECKIPMAYVNCVGTQNVGKTIFAFDGASAVYRPEESEFRAPNFKESVLVYDTLRDSCENFALGKDSVLISESFGQVPSSETAELYEAITSGLGSILHQWNIKNVVIGVSGGIDSALASALYTRVLDPKSVLLVNMPTRYNSDLTRNAAKQLAENLHCPYSEVPVQFDATVSQLSKIKFHPGVGEMHLNDLVLENIQARDRSSRILAGIAAARNSVFTCNANKTELSVGYCTLYGDAGGFLAVLGDLWKHQVYELSRYVNELAGKSLIPEASLSVVPSAELSSKQDVTVGKGDPLIYVYHDALFRTWVEHWDRKTPEDILSAFLNNSLEKILQMGRQDVLDLFHNDVVAFVNDLEKWWFAYRGMGAFKRVQTPPVLALSRRAFGSDHREAIGSQPLSRKYYDLKANLLSSLKKNR